MTSSRIAPWWKRDREDPEIAPLTWQMLIDALPQEIAETAQDVTNYTYEEDPEYLLSYRLKMEVPRAQDVFVRPPKPAPTYPLPVTALFSTQSPCLLMAARAETDLPLDTYPIVQELCNSLNLDGCDFTISCRRGPVSIELTARSNIYLPEELSPNTMNELFGLGLDNILEGADVCEQAFWENPQLSLTKLEWEFTE